MSRATLKTYIKQWLRNPSRLNEERLRNEMFYRGIVVPQDIPLTELPPIRGDEVPMPTVMHSFSYNPSPQVLSYEGEC